MQKLETFVTNLQRLKESGEEALRDIETRNAENIRGLMQAQLQELGADMSSYEVITDNPDVAVAHHFGQEVFNPSSTALKYHSLIGRIIDETAVAEVPFPVVLIQRKSGMPMTSVGKIAPGGIEISSTEGYRGVIGWPVDNSDPTRPVDNHALSIRTLDVAQTASDIRTGCDTPYFLGSSKRPWQNFVLRHVSRSKAMHREHTRQENVDDVFVPNGWNDLYEPTALVGWSELDKTFAPIIEQDGQAVERVVLMLRCANLLSFAVGNTSLEINASI